MIVLLLLNDHSHFLIIQNIDDDSDNNLYIYIIYVTYLYARMFEKVMGKLSLNRRDE